MWLLGAGARLLRRVIPLARERGWVAVLTSSVLWLFGWSRGRLGIDTSTPGEFMWEGRWVPYFHHRYHYTWLNERAVEIALARELLESYSGKAVLEIGNVLGHYLPTSHTVVDKYEQAEGVLNVDVADLQLASRYDLIIAISTLEHVGLDEDVLDPGKPRRAIKALEALLAPGGRLWVTIPVGYNPALDEGLRSGALGFTCLRALRREPSKNVWRSVPLDEVWNASYDWLLYTAHGLVIAELTLCE